MHSLVRKSQGLHETGPRAKIRGWPIDTHLLNCGLRNRAKLHACKERNFFTGQHT